MRNFKRKATTSNEEPPSGPGWSAYVQVPEDFEHEAWVEENDNCQFNLSLSAKVRHFLSYLLFYIKYRIFHFRLDEKIHNSDEEFEDDEEFSKTFVRGIEIVHELRPQILEFSERLIDKGRAEIEYLNKRIVYYRKDFPSNPGYAHYIEDLDGSNKFENGWGHASGMRNKIIESISQQVGFKCAQIEMESL
jgi:hypothetical protein